MTTNPAQTTHLVLRPDQGKTFAALFTLTTCIGVGVAMTTKPTICVVVELTGSINKGWTFMADNRPDVYIEDDGKVV